MSQTLRVLILDARNGPRAALGDRLRSIGHSPLWAKTPEDALRLVENPAFPIGAAIVPPNPPVADLGGALEALRTASPQGRLAFLVEGVRPDEASRARLREAGVEWALWEPYDEATLRFQLNRALSGGDLLRVRRARRAPGGLPARVTVGGRAKEARLYCISSSGAFLETPRPTLPGARVQLEVPRVAGDAPLRGQVVMTNVPGNLARPNLPLGMAVEFQSLSDDTTAEIEHHVAQREQTLSV